MKVTAGVIALLALTSCTIERTVVQESTTTTTSYSAPPTTDRSWRVDEEGFLNTIEKEYGYLGSTKDMALETGYGVCTHLDNGGSTVVLEQMIYDSADDIDSIEFLSFVTASAVIFLCPWNLANFNVY